MTIAPKPSGNKFQDLCTMIGLMTLTWGWAENSLTAVIGIINENAGPIKGYPEAPVSLKKRIACLKVALRDIPILEGFQEEGRLLAKRFVELAPRRHKFVHGATWQFSESQFQIIGIRVIGGNYAVEDHSVDVGDTSAFCAEIAALQDDMVIFLLKIARTFSGLTRHPF